jgi:hypothetical protein
MTLLLLPLGPSSLAFNIEAVYPLGRVYNTTLLAPIAITRVLRSSTLTNRLLLANTPLVQKRLRTILDLLTPFAISFDP